jgi:hypothetical protein
MRFTTAIHSNIDISLLELFRDTMASQGKYYRIRYRGPRNTPLDFSMRRSRDTRAASCLKANAKTFSVYEY